MIGSKPPGLGPEYGAQFDDASIVAAYRARPPYPDALPVRILEIAGIDRPHLLDLGCGPGELTRRLAPACASITAIDASARMIAAARELPGGDAGNIEWIVGAVEDVPLEGPFALALAAESFHWFDWARVCGRLPHLVPSGILFLVEGRFEEESAWSRDLTRLIRGYSTNQEYRPYDLVHELRIRGHFTPQGRATLGPIVFRPTIPEYLTSIHSRNGFSLDRMPPADAHAFDAAVTALLTEHADGAGAIQLQVTTKAAWGVVHHPPARVIALAGR